MTTITIIDYLAQYDEETFMTNDDLMLLEDEDAWLEWLADVAIAMARETEQDELPAIPW